MSSTSTSWTTQGNTKAGATSTSADSLTTGTLVADTLQLASNVIKASDGGSTITLNTDDDVTIAGDLTLTTVGSAKLNVIGASGSYSASINLSANAGDTNSKKWQINASVADAKLNFYNFTSGSWVSKFTIDSTGDCTAARHLYTGGDIYLQGGDILNSSAEVCLSIDGDQVVTVPGVLTIGDDTDADRSIVFGHDTMKARIGIDDNQTKFAISTGNDGDFEANNTFEIDSDGDVSIKGDLTIQGANITHAITCDGVLTASSYVDITLTTDSSDASGDTGALRCEGGASIAKKLYVGTDLDVDGTTNLDAVDIDGAVQLDSTLTVGVDGTGYDVKFYADEPDNYMLWDESEEQLRIVSDDIRASIVLECTVDSATNGPGFQFYRNSNSPSGSSGDYDTLGVMTFIGTNATDGEGSTVTYGRIRTRITDATKDAEGGEVNIDAMGGGTLRNVIKGVGASGNNDMDVTIGNGATSLTKVAGYFAANSATPAAAPNYTVSNLSTDRALDCDSTSDAEVADVLGQVITDLIAIGIFQ